MKYILSIFWALTGMVSGWSGIGTSAFPYEDVGTQRSSRACALQQLLTEIPRYGFMFGHHDDPIYGIGWEYDADRSDVKSVCGDYPAVMSFDLGRLELGHDANLDGVKFDKLRAESVKQYERGGVVSFSWHLDNPVTGKDSWDVSRKGVVRTILPGGENHTRFAGWLDRVADFLNSIRTADGEKVPVLFRPWHEHTGSWFWWGQNLCSADEYKALWRMTVEHLRAKGCDQLLYAYSPGGDCADAASFFERYPGDDLIDLIGFDAYQFNREAYMQQMKNSLDIAAAYAKAHHKILAITETGYETIPDARWWTGTLLPLVKDYPIAYVLLWRNARERANHFYAPYPGHVSAPDFVRFYKDKRSLFVKDVKRMVEMLPSVSVDR